MPDGLLDLADTLDELLDLLAVMHHALVVAAGELMELSEMEQPLPDDLSVLLCEHEGMKVALQHATTAPAKTREQVIAVYRAAYNAHTPEYAMPVSPVLDDVLRQLEAGLELVRRRGLVVPAVGEALRRP